MKTTAISEARESRARFGNLTILPDIPSKNPKIHVRFKCDCGNESEANFYNIRRGFTKGCGCLRLKHRLSNDITYASWYGMFERCNNTKGRDYHRYGGRGITVCPRWNDILNFVEDIGKRPSKGHTIDRIDNNGNYEPGNCRWATWKQQSLNRSCNVILEFNGFRRTEAEWAEVLNIKKATITTRRLFLGWDVDKILTTPVRRYPTRVRRCLQKTLTPPTIA